MTALTHKQIAEVLVKHSAWLRSEVGGQSADLQSADLQGANLQGANLQGANLQGAYLQGAYLQRAYLQGAYLQGAYLQGADLGGAYLQGADLGDTCLAGIPGVTPAALSWHGWEVRDGWVYGWRTARSIHVGSHEYVPGIHVAPLLSTDEHTDCHPGIYMLPTEMAARAVNPSMAVVRCRARCEDVVMLRAVAKGLRTRSLEIQGDETW